MVHLTPTLCYLPGCHKNCMSRNDLVRSIEGVVAESNQKIAEECHEYMNDLEADLKSHFEEMRGKVMAWLANRKKAVQSARLQEQETSAKIKLMLQNIQAAFCDSIRQMDAVKQLLDEVVNCRMALGEELIPTQSVSACDDEDSDDLAIAEHDGLHSFLQTANLGAYEAALQEEG